MSMICVIFLPQQNILLRLSSLFLCSKAQRTWYNCLDLQQKMNCKVWILELMLPLNNLMWLEGICEMGNKYTSSPCIGFI